MRPKLQDVIERAWNEIANLPNEEKPKLHTNQLALELARFYEQDGRTPQQRENTLKADVWTLLCAYSFALRKMPRYWKPEPLRHKNAYSFMAICMRSILTDLIVLASNIGLRLPQDELERYEGQELWVQDIKPLIAEIYGENTMDEALIPTLYEESTEIGKLEKRIYRLALKKAFIKLDDTGKYIKGSLTWSLIAYMCGRIYCKDRVKEDEFGDKKLFKGRSFPATEIQRIFNADIATHRDQLKKPPKNYSKIDELFKNPEASH